VHGQTVANSASPNAIDALVLIAWNSASAAQQRESLLL
jgi:hypothetical protein